MHQIRWVGPRRAQTVGETIELITSNSISWRLATLFTACAFGVFVARPTDAQTAQSGSLEQHVTPAFADLERRKKVEAVLPQIDAAYVDYAAEMHLPGMVYGIVLDGELIHTGATGFVDVAAKIPVTADSRFRIASMTKSFTALAVLKLRDAGKLALQDPVEKYIPEFKRVARLTNDAPPITLRQLMTMTAGFPEDNPWGDRQLDISADELRAFVRGGISMSNVPGIGFEYSNLGYALLGEVVSRVSGMPYQRYITREILEPLGMKDTRWEYTQVPQGKLALGYRREDDAWRPEPLLHDGAYGAVGGLLTTLPDFARYVSFHLSAWPARDGVDTGPVRRATLREMHAAGQTPSFADEKNDAGEPCPSVAAYTYALFWETDCKNVTRLSHGGGLPGFGSHYYFYPHHGVGVIAFANLRYAPMGAINAKVGGLLIDKGGLAPRTLQASDILEMRKQQVAELITSWDTELGAAILAENFFLDLARERRIARARETLAQAGRISSIGAIVPENQLRGTFPLIGEKGHVDVFFTLTPENPPRVQQLRLTFVPSP